MKLILKMLVAIILAVFTCRSSAIMLIQYESGLPQIENHDTSGLKQLIRVDSFRIAIIPPSSGVQFYRDKILFLSMTKNERRMSPKHISFGAVEAYLSDAGDSVQQKHPIFAQGPSFSYPCEGVTFTHDYSTIYFTKITGSAHKEKIFSACLMISPVNGRIHFTGESLMDFCNDDASYSHPALSSDDNLMIFASDRPGSLGGMDLYLSRKNGEKWSSPENMGKTINTGGNEFFPYVDQYNNLYFSSDRLPGFGGYDVFTCKFNGTGWNKPVNLTPAVNSVNDDIAFIISPTDGKTAFFTRKELSGNSYLQLFKVSLVKNRKNIASANLPFVFNGSPVQKPVLVAVKSDSSATPSEAEILAKKTAPEVIKKEAVKISDTTRIQKKQGGKTVLNKPASSKKQPTTKVLPNVKPIQTGEEGQKGIVIYRVQIITAGRPRSDKSITMNGQKYDLFEYFYHGAYRYTVGEFKTMKEAAGMQRLCRQSGYPQAFVAAFKDNIRSLDTGLFK